MIIDWKIYRYFVLTVTHRQITGEVNMGRQKIIVETAE